VPERQLLGGDREARKTVAVSNIPSDRKACKKKRRKEIAALLVDSQGLIL
jgi:hypothetical protein